MKKTLFYFLIGTIFVCLIGCDNIKSNKDADKFSVTTNQGSVIEMDYEDFGNFSLMIPKDFELMSDEAIAIKYPNGNAPSLVYTNEDGTINVALNLNDVAMKNSDIEKYVKAVESTYKQYVNSIDIEFWNEDKHKIGQLEFISPAIDTDIYNRLIAFSDNGYLRIVSFNCTKKYIDEWKDVSEFIIKSLIFE